jgi:serine phosphatase RsbU (regulator of sigma subunit)
MTKNPISSENNGKHSERILLVDDNPVNLRLIRRTLEGRGYDPLTAKNGEAALSVARKEQPGLILLDIMMPGIDGYEVCRRLKVDPATRDIPVIFLSSLNETKDKVRGLDLGAVDYISKPFQAHEVIARVNTHLTIYRLRRELQDQKNELERELQIVAEEQRNLLPRQLPNIDGLKLSAFYQTSRYAGGDYYDIVELPDERCGLMVADAAGHSTQAAVLMAMTYALFRAYPGEPLEPGEVLHYLNGHLCRLTEESFVTAIYSIYDPRIKTLRFARSGHQPPLLYRPSDGRTIALPSKGNFPMGIDAFDDVQVAETKLEPGDRLMFYTDGITEQSNAKGELYGAERLAKQLAGDGGSNPQEIVDAIREDLCHFAGSLPPDDDQLLLLAIVQ